MYLILDTETTGFAKAGVQPRIIQLAFLLLDERYEPVMAYKQLIKPDGWVVPDSDFHRQHGLFQADCEAKGVPIAEAMAKFLEAVQKCKYMIAHNMAYDMPVVASEMIKLGMKSANKPIKFCTMKDEAVVNFCALPRNKWPSLQELHLKLFGVGFDGGHDAWNDVVACAVCFLELARLKVLTLN